MIDEQKLLHNLKKRNRNSLDDIIKIYTPYVSVIVYNTVGCKLSKEDMEEIAKLDTKTSSFFNHYDPEMVKWFDETVKSRRENQDHNKDKKNW